MSKLDKNVVAQFTKLRISSHNLAIEAGRYHKPKLDISLRCCKFCPHTIENEKHFLLHCTKYCQLRTSFVNDISIIFPGFPSLNDDDQFNFIMSYYNGDMVLCDLVMKYVSACNELRNCDT